MTDDWTCGKGLAAHAPLPLAISEMLTALATMLDLHTRAIDLSDDAGRIELTAYASLVAQERVAASLLRAAGNEMTGYRDLPAAGHDMAVLTSPELDAAFRALIDAEKRLLTILASTVAEHEQMLAE